MRTSIVDSFARVRIRVKRTRRSNALAAALLSRYLRERIYIHKERTLAFVKKAAASNVLRSTYNSSMRIHAAAYNTSSNHAMHTYTYYNSFVASRVYWLSVSYTYLHSVRTHYATSTMHMHAFNARSVQSLAQIAQGLPMVTVHYEAREYAHILEEDPIVIARYERFLQTKNAAFKNLERIAKYRIVRPTLT